MDVRLHTEPTEHAASHEAVRRAAVRAEEAGFGAFFRSDHYRRVGDRSGPPRPSDAWLTLAALARETRTIRLGTLVSPVTFRSPGQLAVQVAQVDDMSGGRVELGLGTGWFGAEHEAYALDFSAATFSHLAEQLEVVRGLWGTPEGGRYDFTGRRYSLAGAEGVPTVQRPHPPIVVGGAGTVRTPALAVAHAAEFNAAFTSPSGSAERFERVRKALADSGRPQDSVSFSVIHTVCCGRSDAEVARRAETIGEPFPDDAFRGSPEQVVERISAQAEAGADRVYLRLLDLDDLDHVDLIASEVLPRLP